MTAFSTVDADIAKEAIGLIPAQRRIEEYWEGGAVGVRPPPFEEIGKRLTALFEGHAIFHRQAQRWFGPKQLHLHPVIAARLFLSRASKRGAEEALSWLRKVYGTKHADVLFLAEVDGLDVDEPVSLSNGVRFSSLSSLRDTPMGRSLHAAYSSPNRIVSRVSLQPPSIAIYEQKNLPATVEYSGPHHSIEIERAVCSLVMATPNAAPILGNSWVEVADDDLEAFQYGMIWGGSRFDGPRGSGMALKLDESAIGRADAFLQAVVGVGTHLEVAAERLIMARRRLSAANRVIDAAICLEALLLSDLQPGEMTYRLKLRAALLLGANTVERRQIQRVVGEFYRLRGKAVHRGFSSKEPDDAACIKEGLDICARALAAIVSLKKSPDWTEIELNGGLAQKSSPAPPISALILAIVPDPTLILSGPHQFLLPSPCPAPRSSAGRSCRTRSSALLALQRSPDAICRRVGPQSRAGSFQRRWPLATRCGPDQRRPAPPGNCRLGLQPRPRPFR